MKNTLFTIGAIVVGNVIFDKFIARVEGSEGGFVDVKPGIGLDDLARAGTVMLALFAVRRFA